MVREETVLRLATVLEKNMKSRWDGKAAIEEMKNQNYAHWKQME